MAGKERDRSLSGSGLVAVQPGLVARARPIGPGGTIEGPLVAAGYLASGFDSSPAQQVVEVIVAVLAAIALLLTAAVALYNRPKLLVPPQLRKLPGAVDEWKGAEVAEEDSSRRL